MNTNKMLWRGFSGVKTGSTARAGPCLCVSKVLRTGQNLVITVLNSKDMESRWEDVKKLADWAAVKYQRFQKSGI